MKTTLGIQADKCVIGAASPESMHALPGRPETTGRRSVPSRLLSRMMRIWTRGSAAACFVVLAWACSSSEERDFGGQSGTGGSSGDASAGKGGGGGVGGTTGSGGASGGSGGSGGSGTGGTGPDASTCSTNSDCDDDNTCNGSETCKDGACAPGTALPDDTSCSVSLADGGTVADAGGDAGVEYSCLGGVCSYRCGSDADCDDADVCTGVETCSPGSRTCQKGTPPMCDDSDACTENLCDKDRGCEYPLIDADADGHAAETLGACGDDCDDSDDTIFTGAGELCDGKDNDCDNSTDETAPVWYVDCDGDGFAPTGAVSLQQCTKPPAHASCGAGGGNWTATRPTSQTNTDCWDAEPAANPSSTDFHPDAISGAPASRDFDWNCDTLEEKRYPAGNVSTGATCSFQGCNPFCGCSGSSGYVGTVPACEGSSSYTVCGMVNSGGLFSCQRSTALRKQECR